MGVGNRKADGDFEMANVDTTKLPDSANKVKLAQLQIVYPDADYNNGKEIDTKHITLPGGARSTGDAYYNVYGNKDTVYLTAKLGELKSSGGNYGVIKDVANRTVGVEKASISVWNTGKAVQKADDTKITGTPPAIATTSQGVYVLYDIDGIVIAAVVVGEDAGASKNLVYVHSSGLEEEVDAATGDGKAATGEDWIWYRKAIQDGQEVMLEEVGSESSYLENMVQYQWYEIKQNGDGEVVESTDAMTALASSSKALFVSDHKVVSTEIERDNIDTVLYYTGKGLPGAGLTGEMKLQGNTLFVDTTHPSGFAVKDDVKAVLHQWNRNTNTTEVREEDGLDGLQQIINWVNEYKDAREENPYYVSAIVEKGGATVVVVRDTYNSYNPGDGDDKNKEFTSNGITLVVSENVKASNFAAVIDSSNKMTFQFDTDMGAAASTTFSYSYTIKNADGVVIEKGTATSDAGAPQFKDDITHIMLQDGKEYTLTITDVVPFAYKMTVDSTDANITKNDVSVNSGATSLTSAAQSVTLKIDQTKIVAPTDVTVTFTITGVDTKALTKAAGVTGEDGTYTFKTTKAALGAGAGVTVLTGVKATGEVKFTVTSVVDASSTVAVVVKLAAGSEKYVTLTQPTTTTVAAGTTTVNLTGATLTDATGGIVTKYAYTVSGVATNFDEGDVLGTNNTSVPVAAAVVGTPVVITVTVTPTEFTAGNLLFVGETTNTAASLTFDGEGYLNEDEELITGGLTTGDHYEVDINGVKDVIDVDASGKLVAGEKQFKVDPAKLLNGDEIEIRIFQVRTITGAGVDTYVRDGAKYDLPSKGSFGGTGLLVDDGTTPAYQVYGATVASVDDDLTLDAGYVKVTVTKGSKAAKITTTEDTTGLTAAGSTYVKVGSTVKVECTVAGQAIAQIKAKIVDTNGTELLAETELNGVTAASGKDATSEAAEDYDITVAITDLP